MLEHRDERKLEELRYSELEQGQAGDEPEKAQEIGLIGCGDTIQVHGVLRGKPPKAPGRINHEDTRWFPEACARSAACLGCRIEVPRRAHRI